jgi:hypothetical protein
MTVTMPLMMAWQTEPIALTMPMRHAPMAWKTLWICLLLVWFRWRRVRYRETYARDDGTHIERGMILRFRLWRDRTVA